MKEGQPVDHGEFVPGVKDPNQFASMFELFATFKRYSSSNLEAELRTEARVAELRRKLDQPCSNEDRRRALTEIALLRELQITSLLEGH